MSERMLTFRSGGWVLLVMAAMVLAILAWALAGPLMGHRRVGDGRTVESYGFALEPAVVATGEIVASGEPRDFLPAFRSLGTMPGSDMEAFNARKRRKYVVSDDRVIGVTIGDESRAYPITLLNGHEIALDELGGVPIAVTYSPLGDSVAVYDRRVDGKTLDFGVSGLLRNANLLMYDVVAEGDAAARSSLWSQYEGRAIAGPLAGRELVRVPGTCVTTWEDWFATHPGTTVTLRDEGQLARYRQISYERYFESPRIDFPLVREVPAVEGMTLKSPVVLLERGDARAIVPLERFRKKGDSVRVPVELGDATVTLVIPDRTGAWRVEGGKDTFARSSLWFLPGVMVDGADAAVR
jgi:hypothetical protein